MWHFLFKFHMTAGRDCKASLFPHIKFPGFRGKIDLSEIENNEFEES